MIVAPTNPNAVKISTIPTGCCKTEFDSTYPIHLNGIINQEEFKESIDNINRAISNRKHLLILGLVLGICLIAGMVLFIVGGVTATKSGSFDFPVLVGVGLGVFILGMIIMLVGCIAVQIRFSTRLQQAIAAESTKYSTRSRNPCTWRLYTSSHLGGTYREPRRVTRYHIAIDIGNSGGNGTYQYNQGYSQPSAVYGQSMPLPNSGYTMTGFCPRCGGPRENPAARFCPSCGELFNK